MTAYGYEKSILIYQTNNGNLSVNEIADIEGIQSQTVRNKIGRGLYTFEFKKSRRPPGAKNITKKTDNRADKLNSINIGSWEKQQCQKQ